MDMLMSFTRSRMPSTITRSGLHRVTASRNRSRRSFHGNGVGGEAPHCHQHTRDERLTRLRLTRYRHQFPSRKAGLAIQMEQEFHRFQLLLRRNPQLLQQQHLWTQRRLFVRMLQFRIQLAHYILIHTFIYWLFF